MALRVGAVTMAVGVIAAHASEDAAFPSDSLRCALLLVLGMSAVLAMTNRARLGMLGLGAAALLLDMAAGSGSPAATALALACHAARWLAPLAFVLASSRNPGAAARARVLLAVAAAATFAGHGLKAFQAPPNFVAYLDCAFRLVTAADCPAASTDALLLAIGITDIAVAALVLRNRRGASTALAWMVVWGGATAVIRCVHGGLEAWPLTAERLPNALVPLALLLMRRPSAAS
jgi:hypothetical protein